MRLDRTTEQRLQDSVESALTEVVGTDEAARLMQASEQVMAPPPESRTAKVARLMGTRRGRERLKAVKAWTDVDRA